METRSALRGTVKMRGSTGATGKLGWAVRSGETAGGGGGGAVLTSGTVAAGAGDSADVTGNLSGAGAEGGGGSGTFWAISWAADSAGPAAGGVEGTASAGGAVSDRRRAARPRRPRLSADPGVLLSGYDARRGRARFSLDAHGWRARRGLQSAY